MNKAYPVCLSIALLVWAGISQGQEKWSEDQQAIIAANNGYIQAMLGADLDALMTFYTDDATLLPPSAPPLIGKDAVRASWAESFEQIVFVDAVSLFDEIIVLGDWAYGRGRYKGQIKAADGEFEAEERLNFSGLWRREPDGSWRIARDMWNSAAAVRTWHAQDSSPAHRYLDHLVALWKEDASSPELEAFGRLLSEDATYQHPRVGITMEGRATILDAMSGFLGKSRSPEVSRVEVLNGQRVVVLGFNLNMEVRSAEGWLPVERRQVIVLEISDDLVKRVSDNW